MISNNQLLALFPCRNRANWITSDNFIHKRLELTFGERAHLGCLDLSIFEYHQSGYAANAILLRCNIVAVYVHLSHFKAIAILAGDFLNDGANRNSQRLRFVPSSTIGPIILQGPHHSAQ